MKIKITCEIYLLSICEGFSSSFPFFFQSDDVLETLKKKLEEKQKALGERPHCVLRGWLPPCLQGKIWIPSPFSPPMIFRK